MTLENTQHCKPAPKSVSSPLNYTAYLLLDGCKLEMINDRIFNSWYPGQSTILWLFKFTNTYTSATYVINCVFQSLEHEFHKYPIPKSLDFPKIAQQSLDQSEKLERFQGFFFVSNKLGRIGLNENKLKRIICTHGH